MIELTQEQHWAVTAVVGVMGLFLGHFVPKWRDRKDHAQANLDNTTALVARREVVFSNYAAALAAVADDEVTFDQFVQIATTGVQYFDHINLICGVILSDQVNPEVRDGTLLPKVRGVADRTLPLHYAKLENLANKNGYPWNGRHRLADHSKIHAVAEKYGLVGDPDS